MRNKTPECNGCNEYVQLERRALLSAAWKVGAAAAVSAPAWLPRMAFAADAVSGRDLVVCVFLRGGSDGLTLCVPHGDDEYYNARNVIAVPRPDAPGDAKAIDLDGFFGLPPALAGFKTLYDAGQLAFVHATGLNDGTRSHFEAQGMMEAGTAGVSDATGWLARHLLAVEGPPDATLRAISASTAIPRSLQGAPATIAIPDIDSYGLVGRGNTAAERQSYLSSLYEGAMEPAKTSAANVTATVDLIAQINAGGYTPANGAEYPESDWGIGLRTIAQIAKAEVGLEAACVDLGGWDSHSNQGTLNGALNGLMTEFANGIMAFHADMQDCLNSLTIVMMSEFGRRVQENFSGGCDHGHGNAMMVLGGNVNGGQVIADWPGLHPDQLDDQRDLAITTDYRDVLAEILQKRALNNSLETVFPGYTPTFKSVVT